MGHKLLTTALLLVAVLFSRPVAAEEIYQLRTYELLPDSKDRFHVRFKTHAFRIMIKHGFDVTAIWEAGDQGSPKFVYLLRWRSEEHMKAAWEAFMSDEEWIRIKRETAEPGAPIMGGIENNIMRLTDYSPILFD